VGYVSLLGSAYMIFSVLQKLLGIEKVFINVPEENSRKECQSQEQKYTALIGLTGTYSQQWPEENPCSERSQ